MNHFLVAKTGQLSLMPTIGLETPAPEPPQTAVPEIEPVAEQVD